MPKALIAPCKHLELFYLFIQEAQRRNDIGAENENNDTQDIAGDADIFRDIFRKNRPSNFHTSDIIMRNDDFAKNHSVC